MSTGFRTDESWCEWKENRNENRRADLKLKERHPVCPTVGTTSERSGSTGGRWEGGTPEGFLGLRNLWKRDQEPLSTFVGHVSVSTRREQGRDQKVEEL